MKGNNTLMALSFTRTLRLKVRAEAYAWLNAAAGEVNVVFNNGRVIANAQGIRKHDHAAHAEAAREVTRAAAAGVARARRAFASAVARITLVRAI